MTDSGGDDFPVVHTLAELAGLLGQHSDLYIRWSNGPAHDREERSRDHASGLDLPGLAVNPLRPPSWWTLPVEAWLARQIKAYDHLGTEEPDQYAWVLTGAECERGPDNEPLVVDITPVARLAPSILHEAAEQEPTSDRDADQDASWRS